MAAVARSVRGDPKATDEKLILNAERFAILENTYETMQERARPWMQSLAIDLAREGEYVRQEGEAKARPS
jgi:hypothetical protein